MITSKNPASVSVPREGSAWLYTDPCCKTAAGVLIMDRKYIKHGMRHHPLYYTWRDIRRRCYNKSCSDYAIYGGRGIEMCAAWIDDPKAFFDHIQSLNGFGKIGLTLDRKDNDKGYFPGNLRWVSKTIQVLNRNIQKNNKTGYVGVCLTQGVFKSTIKVNKKSIHLGLFETPEEAVDARNKYIISMNLKDYKLQSISQG